MKKRTNFFSQDKTESTKDVEEIEFIKNPTNQMWLTAVGLLVLAVIIAMMYCFCKTNGYIIFLLNNSIIYLKQLSKETRRYQRGRQISLSRKRDKNMANKMK